MKLKQKFRTNQDRQRLANYLARKKSPPIRKESCQQLKQSLTVVKKDKIPFSSNIESEKIDKRPKSRIINKNDQDEILKNDVRMFLDRFKKENNDNFKIEDEDEDDEGENINEQKFSDFTNISKSCPIDNDPFERRSIELAEKARQTLSTSMFRHLNEYLYTHSSYQSYKHFNLKKFQQYHEAYERIMNLWPLKPIDFIIDYLKVYFKNLFKKFVFFVIF